MGVQVPPSHDTYCSRTQACGHRRPFSFVRSRFRRSSRFTAPQGSSLQAPLSMQAVTQAGCASMHWVWHSTRTGRHCTAQFSSPSHFSMHLLQGGLHLASQDVHASAQRAMHAHSSSRGGHSASSGPPHISVSREEALASAPPSVTTAAGCCGGDAAPDALALGAPAALTVGALGVSS